MLLKHAFGSATEGAYLHIRSDGRLSNLSCLKAKTKVCEALIRDILFVDDAAVATHTQQEPQTQIYGSFLQGLQGLWADYMYQSEEDERPGTGFRGAAIHHHR